MNIEHNDLIDRWFRFDIYTKWYDKSVWDYSSVTYDEEDWVSINGGDCWQVETNIKTIEQLDLFLSFIK